MINRECFEKEWFESLKKTFASNVDVYMLERTIYAFELLCQLTKINNNFIFKGGTSLVLILSTLKRLSIDIDVIGEFSEDNLKSIIDNSIFIRFEKDERKNNLIPKKHFKFYYSSKLDSAEKYILLDVLGSDDPYSRVTEQLVSTSLFNIDENVFVKLPSIDDIIGDKLTAFAPTTIGIQYGSDKSLEILKQLYDIHNLFNQFSNRDIALASYSKIAAEQFTYRQLKLSITDSIKDTFNASVKLCKLDFKGSVEDDETKELRKGVQALSGFLISNDFNLQVAKTAASKAALLSILLRFPEKKINLNNLFYDETRLPLLKDFQLPAFFGSLNTLKKVNIEAFYYWYIISTLIDNNEWLSFN